MKTSAEKKREAILQTMFNGKRVHKVGNAYMVTLPTAWCRLYAWQVDGSLWVGVISEAGKLVVESIDEEEAVKLMEANDVKPAQLS